MGSFLKGPDMPAPPVPPPPPPAANPPPLANAGVQAAGAAANRRMASAAGQGSDNTIQTGSEGALKPSTAKTELLGG